MSDYPCRMTQEWECAVCHKREQGRVYGEPMAGVPPGWVWLQFGSLITQATVCGRDCLAAFAADLNLVRFE